MPGADARPTRTATLGRRGLSGCLRDAPAI
jgi:hypothetical protein